MKIRAIVKFCRLTKCPDYVTGWFDAPERKIRLYFEHYLTQELMNANGVESVEFEIMTESGQIEKYV